MVNPYFCYSLAFGVASLTYLLRWSDLYPPISAAVLIFLVTTMIAFAVLGVVVTRSRIILFQKLKTPEEKDLLLMTLFVYALWCIEFMHAGGIPLLKILLKKPYDYRMFGVPSLHVFVVTFSSFFTIYLFHHYLSGRSRSTLALYLINLMAAILIYNRGMFLFNLSASVFLYFIYRNRFTWKQLLIGGVSVIVLLFLFGVLGSLRVSREAGGSYSNDYFLEIGEASTPFRRSPIPGEFFWSYIYISSPLANLQHNINTYPVTPITSKKLGELINNEIMMDFISKRINSLFNLKPVDDYRIPGPFNVSTVYSRPFSYLGWYGILVMVLVLMILPWLYFKLLPAQSPFFLTGLVILCTMYLFLAFDNTIRFTGLSFQLVYPVLLHFVIGKFPAAAKFFVNNKVTRV